MGQPYEIGVGEAAFYGPKIDFQVKDAHRREFTNSTVQVDFQLPERFDLEYVAEDGSRQRPVMVHRGAAGVHGAPVQLPDRALRRRVSDLAAPGAGGRGPDHRRAARVRARHRSAPPQGEAASRGRRPAGAHAAQDPRRAGAQGAVHDIAGAREAESQHVNVRDRAGNQTDEALEEFVQRVVQEVAERRR